MFAVFKQWHGPRRRDPVRLAQHPWEVVLHETLPYPRGYQHVPFDQEHEVRPCLINGEVAKGIDGKQRLYNRGENISQKSLVILVLSLPSRASTLFPRFPPILPYLDQVRLHDVKVGMLHDYPVSANGHVNGV